MKAEDSRTKNVKQKKKKKQKKKVKNKMSREKSHEHVKITATPRAQLKSRGGSDVEFKRVKGYRGPLTKDWRHPKYRQKKRIQERPQGGDKRSLSWPRTNASVEVTSRRVCWGGRLIKETTAAQRGKPRWQIHCAGEAFMNNSKETHDKGGGVIRGSIQQYRRLERKEMQKGRRKKFRRGQTNL